MTDLITLATPEELAEAAAIFAEQGQDEAAVIKLPFLKIQYDPDLMMKVPHARMGMYYVHGPSPAYAENIKMRVLLQHTQWRQQSTEDFKMINKSILMDKRGQDPIDMLGGVRCGRPEASIWKGFSDAEKKPYKDVVCTRVMRGIVSYDGVDQNGEKKRIENEPVQFHMKGMNFMGLSKVIDNLKGSGRQLRAVWLDMNTDKEGKTFITNFDIDYDTPALLTSDVVATLKVFNDQARQENDSVKKKHYAALGTVDHAPSDSFNGYSSALEHSA